MASGTKQLLDQWSPTQWNDLQPIQGEFLVLKSLEKSYERLSSAQQDAVKNLFPETNSTSIDVYGRVRFLHQEFHSAVYYAGKERNNNSAMICWKINGEMLFDEIVFFSCISQTEKAFAMMDIMILAEDAPGTIA